MEEHRKEKKNPRSSKDEKMDSYTLFRVFLK